MADDIASSFENGFATDTLCDEWRPSRLAPIGCVYFAHGMGEHAFAYRHLGQQLAAAGFVVLAVDYYGHGLSDGSRLSVGFYDAVKDYLDFVSATALRRHDLPRFMLGQSLGGLLAMHVVLTDQSQWAGLVLSAAAIGVDWDVAKLAAYATFSTLARLGVKPDWKVLPAFSGAEICRDPEGAMNYDTDPLNYHGKLKVRLALDAMQAMISCRRRYPEYKLPILVLHGTQDITTSLSAAERFVKEVRSKDVHFHKLDGLSHLLMMEPERQQVINEVISWIVNRTHHAEPENHAKQVHIASKL
eukprot:CAMPEP_0114246306 /NCGR_PEP_ID=MMETSP0058-20121206/12386_1 /TAXON_ID=36894 /ORGANISM="Pyramimonas parkeae, CCMP726" /LENGTH=300 /DNA_ID=CAMNT_0001359471 /DNA_START=1346 /DNA_END=2249 /DNA_ORIENTATION=-